MIPVGEETPLYMLKGKVTSVYVLVVKPLQLSQGANDVLTSGASIVV